MRCERVEKDRVARLAVYRDVRYVLRVPVFQRRPFRPQQPPPVHTCDHFQATVFGVRFIQGNHGRDVQIGIIVPACLDVLMFPESITAGQLEVDFVLGSGEVAVEVKGTSRLDSKHVKSLLAFVEEYSPRMAIIVCNEKARRIHDKVLVLPWREFLDELWEGKIIL